MEYRRHTNVKSAKKLNMIGVRILNNQTDERDCINNCRMGNSKMASNKTFL